MTDVWGILCEVNVKWSYSRSVNTGLGDGVVPSGSKPSPEPILIQFTDAYMGHKASESWLMSHEISMEKPFNRWQCSFHLKATLTLAILTLHGFPSQMDENHKFINYKFSSNSEIIWQCYTLNLSWFVRETNMLGVYYTTTKIPVSKQTGKFE